MYISSACITIKNILKSSTCFSRAIENFSMKSNCDTSSSSNTVSFVILPSFVAFSTLILETLPFLWNMDNEFWTFHKLQETRQMSTSLFISILAEVSKWCKLQACNNHHSNRNKLSFFTKSFNNQPEIKRICEKTMAEYQYELALTTQYKRWEVKYYRTMELLNRLRLVPPYWPFPFFSGKSRYAIQK